MYFVDKEKCFGCAICVNACPVEAISMVDGKAVIDENRCIDCGQCVRTCPRNAIYSNLNSQQNFEPEQKEPVYDSIFTRGYGVGQGLGRGMGRSFRSGRGRGRGRGLKRGI